MKRSLLCLDVLFIRKLIIHQENSSYYNNNDSACKSYAPSGGRRKVIRFFHTLSSYVLLSFSSSKNLTFAPNCHQSSPSLGPPFIFSIHTSPKFSHLDITFLFNTNVRFHAQLSLLLLLDIVNYFRTAFGRKIDFESLLLISLHISIVLFRKVRALGLEKVDCLQHVAYRCR